MAALTVRVVARPIRALTDTRHGLAGADLERAVRRTGGTEGIGRMVPAVQVFKDNLIRSRQVEAATARARASAAAQRRDGQRPMAAGLDAAVGGRHGQGPHPAAAPPTPARSRLGPRGHAPPPPPTPHPADPAPYPRRTAPAERLAGAAPPADPAPSSPTALPAAIRRAEADKTELHPTPATPQAVHSLLKKKKT
ncbi:hypothetical protein [Methylobacterium radiotolerans]|uniref:hypothetical protein n=1 Tax=Methylobacterium radiotolerans TaxID=31998 RepID=UPI0015C66D5D|nr:hypothetical protein [Methylobacterium radiotolerans]